MCMSAPAFTPLCTMKIHRRIDGLYPGRSNMPAGPSCVMVHPLPGTWKFGEDLPRFIKEDSVFERERQAQGMCTIDKTKKISVCDRSA